LEDPGKDGRLKLKCNINKEDESVLTGYIWLRIGTSGGLLGKW
jgi:hypothetical protein